MPLIATRGAASAQGFGEFAQAAAPVYIEDVFSTYLYTGNGSTQTITNGIDLSGKGGLVWTKDRSVARGHVLIDTVRGASEILASNTTGASSNFGSPYLSFLSTGYSLVTSDASVNGSDTYVSWTFREQPKFFDVVTYTGNGSNRTISHNLGSVPGCIIVKRTDAAADWQVYHRSSGNNKYLVLNSTGDEITSSTRWNDTTPTSTVFSLGTDTTVNANGGTYVAYLFAHDAGGFGLSGTDNVITCGGYTGNGSATGPTITLGYEPQWLLIKNSGNSPFNWQVIDNMRGMPVGSADANLQPNLSNAESSTEYVTPTATGFQITSSSGQVNGNGNSHIYVAIRRGPMKTPTSGTSVYNGISFTGNDTSGTRSTGLNAFDLLIPKRTSASLDWVWLDKLRGLSGTTWLASNSTSAETASGGTLDTINSIDGQRTQDGLYITKTSNYGYVDASGSTYAWYAMRRAPGFFDVVCATTDGNGVYTGAHNLGVAPELIITKTRNAVDSWLVYSAALGVNYYIVLNSNAAAVSSTGVWGSAPTASTFTIFNNIGVATQVSYLFATVAGVSKVGSYTGTGTTLQVNCGFTGGARFVLIKRTDSTGDWYVWDSARGIVAGNDPYLLLNSTAAEVTNTDYVDTYSAGFEISSTAPAAINANGGTFIFLAVS